ncbi:MAG: PQQ-binding-like beta-propeller repeat protein, partial [Deltaproteobacteria bacterium]
MKSLFLLSFFAATSLAAADPVPLGHPDFYPSPERPVGWRGDRTGAFPGATPVTTWNSKTGANIVWKSRMPSPSWGQPIVVGEKVFTTSDPNLLICVNVHDGKILWQKEVDHTTLMPPEKAKKAKEELVYINSLFPIYVDACRDMDKMMTLAKAKGFKPDELKNAACALGTLDNGKQVKSKGVKSYDKAEVEKALADPEIKKMFDSLVNLRTEYDFNFQDPRRGDNWTAIGNSDYTGMLYGRSTEGKKIVDRVTTLAREYDIWSWPQQPWYSITTMTFGSPCSDGKYLYVAFPNDQVACYDLNGICKWMVWDRVPNSGRMFQTRFIHSPLLVGDNLVVNQNGHIRVYDKSSGKKIWSITSPYTGNHQQEMRPTPEAWSPMHAHLAFGEKGLDVISDGYNNLYRLSDGKIVGTIEIEAKHTPNWSYHAVIHKDYLLVFSSDSYFAYRMKVSNTDQVECVKIWDKPYATSKDSSNYNVSGILWNDKYSDGALSFDLATGESIPTTKIATGYQSPLLAGNWIIGSGSVCPVGQVGREIVNFLEDNTETEDPERSRKPYCGQTGPGFTGPGWRPLNGYSSLYAAANRLFY